MGEGTNIQYAHNTWNPWLGCAMVDERCLNCYARELMDNRLGRVRWGDGGTRQKTSRQYWEQPYKWQWKAAEESTRVRVFASLCDPFESWGGEMVDHHGGAVQILDGDWYRPETMDDTRAQLFACIDQTPNIDWILLTKRPQNVRRMWPGGRRDNVWIGYSASDQRTLDLGLGHLLALRDLSPVLCLSLEPLLGPVEVVNGKANRYSQPTDRTADGIGIEWTDPGIDFCPIDWIVAGGESGKNARPCYVQWLRSLVTQCRNSRTPCFIKQLGAFAMDCDGENPEQASWRIQLDHAKGGEPEEWPEDLRVRELP